MDLVGATGFESAAQSCGEPHASAKDGEHSNAELAIESDYLSGMSIRLIARKYRMGKNTVGNALRRLGVTIRPPNSGRKPMAEHPLWKGDKARYHAFHYRVRRIRGTPKHCEHCGTTNPDKRYDWANVSGKYDDPSDYIRLCRACHCQADWAEAGGQLRDLPRLAHVA